MSRSLFDDLDDDDLDDDDLDDDLLNPVDEKDADSNVLRSAPLPPAKEAASSDWRSAPLVGGGAFLALFIVLLAFQPSLVGRLLGYSGTDPLVTETVPLQETLPTGSGPVETPSTLRTVPKLQGRKRGEAVAALELLELRVQVALVPARSRDKVIRTVPGAGETVRRGTRVIVQMGDGTQKPKPTPKKRKKSKR